MTSSPWASPQEPEVFQEELVGGGLAPPHQTITHREDTNESQEMSTANDWPDVGCTVAGRMRRAPTYTYTDIYTDPTNAHGHIYSYANVYTYSHANGYTHAYTNPTDGDADANPANTDTYNREN